MEEQKNPIIEMTDNEGRTVKAELYDVFEFENQKYALLVPVTEDEDAQKMMAVMHLIEVDGGYGIEEIASDEEWERVQAFLNSPCGCEGKEGGCGGNCNCEDKGKENCGCGGNCNCGNK